MRPGVIGGMGAAVIAAMLAHASLALAAPRAPGQELSPRLAALARSPELRSAPARKQAARLDVATDGAGSLMRYGERLVVQVRVAGDAQAAADELRAAGAEVLGVSPSYGIVTTAVAPASLEDVGQVPGVEAVTEQLTPATSQVTPAALGGGGCVGDVTSEGDDQLNAPDVRGSYGITGKGVEVGILSDSFDRAPGSNAAADVESGDLPGPGNPCGRTAPVRVLEDLPPQSNVDPTDEGRAMAQLVHDLAPAARLSFATGFFSDPFDMARNIRRLANAGAHVIVDDVTWPEEPFFQAGPVDDAIDDVTDQGVVYFSSAGNSNARPNSQFGSWETPTYRNPADCPALSLPPQDEECLDFDPAPGPGNADRGYEVRVANGGTLDVIMQWAEPWYGVDTDLDFYLVDSSNDVLAQSEFDSVMRQQPVERWFWQNTTGSPQDVRIVVNRASGTGSVRVKLRNGFASSGVTSNEYANPDEPDVAGPTIMGHNGAQDALSVAAVRHDDSDLLEPFSSRGPVTHYFRPVNGTAPAPPLPSPRVLEKPDISASDGVQTTFFSPFFGTSAAAPHAAAVAALQLDATPNASPGAIAAAQRGTAVPVGEFGLGEAGAGLVDALAAVEWDTRGPATTLKGRPNKRTTKRRAKFTFHAEARADYECKLDGQAWKSCKSPETYKVKRGTHHFRVRATDQLGNIGPVTKDKWRRVRR
jgi:subtilisin family serine protease